MDPALGDSIFCPAAVTFYYYMFSAHFYGFGLLKTRVYIPGTSAFGDVTGNVLEVTLFLAIRAHTNVSGLSSMAISP